MAARARTLLRYVADSGENYRVRPNFSADLRDRLQQAIDAVETTTDGSEKMRLVETFSQLFQEVYDCKKAYIALENAVEALLAAVYDNPDATDDEVEAEMKNVADKYGMDLDTVKKYLRTEDVKEQVMREKVIKVVADSAKAVAPEAKEEETKAEEEGKND